MNKDADKKGKITGLDQEFPLIDGKEAKAQAIAHLNWWTEGHVKKLSDRERQDMVLVLHVSIRPKDGISDVVTPPLRSSVATHAAKSDNGRLMQTPYGTYEHLEGVIGVNFRNRDLLSQALAHWSAMKGDAERSNERLEYLGDSVLGLIVKEHVFQLGSHDEGTLTEWHNALVCTEHLAEIASALQLGAYLQLSRGAERSGDRQRTSLLADALEALIAAIYLDQGIDRAREFVHRFIISNFDNAILKARERDAKSVFQELAQQRLHVTPSYKIIAEEGPDNSKVYTVAVCLNDIEVARGSGTSKKRAEQSAASAALAIVKW